MRLKNNALFWAFAFLLAALALSAPAARADPVVLTPAIPVGTQPAHIAITPNGQFAYVANNGGTTVNVIDTTTNTVVGSPITVGSAPWGVAITADGQFAYVTNMSSNTVSVIDTQKAQDPATQASAVVATIAVGAGPHGVAINGTFAYVNNEGNGSVSVIDTTDNTVVGSPITVGTFPWDIAISPDGQFAYVSNLASASSSVSVIDTQKAQNPATQASAVVDTIPVGSAPEGIAINGTFAYVVNARGGTVNVIDITDNTVVGSPIAVGGGPSSIAITPDGQSAYVTNTSDNTVSVIDLQKAQDPATQADAVVNTLAVGAFPYQIAITPDGQFAYVSDYNSKSVTVIALGATLSSLHDGNVGAAYSGVITVSNATGASTFTVTTGADSLPPGLTLDAATGKLTGVPTAAGTYAFTVSASSTVRGLTETPVTRNYTVVIRAAVAAAPIPTLGEVALVALALLLGMSAVAVHRRGL